MSDSEPLPDQKPKSTLSRVRQKLKFVSVLVVSGAQILDILNVTGLIFSLPFVSQKYNVELDEASWMLSAYALTFGSFILMAGRLGDIVGHRATFMTGMAIIAVTSLINAVVQKLIVLFVIRAFQGIGAALTFPSSFALLAHSYKGRAQAIAFAVVGSAAAMGGIIGVLIGGGFAETTLGYRGLMFLSLGLAALFLSLIFFVVEETPRNLPDLKKIDYPGTILTVVGLVLLVFGFTSAPGRWRSARVIAPIVLGAVFIALFFIHELFVAEKYFKVQPLVPRRAWSYVNLIPISLASMLNFASLYVNIFASANQLQALRGKSPIGAAVEIIPLGVVFALFSVLGGTIYGRVPTRITVTIGPIFQLIGSVIWSQVKEETYWRKIFPAYIFQGAGSALFMSTFINAVSNSAPLADQGIVSGMALTFGQIGVALGLAISSSELGAGTLLSDFQNNWYTLAAYSALSIIISALLVKKETGTVGQQAAAEVASNNDADVVEVEKAEKSPVSPSSLSDQLSNSSQV